MAHARAPLCCTSHVNAPHPEVLPTLRMATCPPVAVDRLIGLAGVKPGLVKSIENDGKLPARMGDDQLGGQLTAICRVLRKLLDKDIFVWLGRQQDPTEAEVYRAATIVADRLCGAVANPIIRNAQEQRQLKAIGVWLERRGYKRVRVGGETRFDTLPEGSFAVHVNVPVRLKGTAKGVNIPADVVIIAKGPGEPPLLIEAKSAGDFANVNKRRKEEAMKMSLLRQTYGDGVRYGLFLCGYFDSGYLGYEAAEGIDWVWEHRIDELEQFGL